MSDPPFSQGPAAFPETRWSAILGAADPENPAYRKKMEALCQAYWKPVWAYYRYTKRMASDEALDLAQGFFVHLLESPILERADPTRARFRTYLKTCLANYAANIHEARERVKRGGGTKHVAIDPGKEEGGVSVPDEAAQEPADALDREWRRLVVQRALASLGKSLGVVGKTDEFEVFRAYYFPPDGSPEPTYASISEKFGMAGSRLVNVLHRTRRRYREAILEELRDSTTSEESARIEYRELFGEDP